MPVDRKPHESRWSARARVVSVLVPLLLSTAGLDAPRAAGPPPDLALEFVVGGFTRPVAVRHAGDGTGRLFIVEQRGVIRIYDVPSAMLLPTPFLDIDALVDSAGNEQGLLGLAFHPDFEHNGLFFVNYTRNASPLDRTVIARYRVSANPNVADPASAVTLLEIEQDFSNHNGGNILFGPDGYLYIGMGDGGSGGDPLDRAQNLGVLLGKMLRIDVDGTSPAGEVCGLDATGYSIPPDNPFVGGAGSCDEIWAYGLRNPWRFSFDRLTGDLFIGDVGQGAVEEVDYQSASSAGGTNYGWPCMEGDNMPNFGPCDGATLVAPIFDYTHAEGFSITGGYMYRGPIASFRGTYVVADYGSGRVWFGTPAGANWTFGQWAATPHSITSFGEDEIGNLYIADFATSAVHRFALPASTGGGEVPDGSTGADPLLLAKSGADLSLTWGASCASSDTDYGIYEGQLGDFASHQQLLCTTGGATSGIVTPGPDDHYYLVVPRNALREGSYGQNSFGMERPVGPRACRDQALKGCPP